MKTNELLHNLPSQTYKVDKYDFVVKLENQQYSFVGYRWNNKRTFVISKFENEIYFSSLEGIKEMINYLVTDKIF